MLINSSIQKANRNEAYEIVRTLLNGEIEQVDKIKLALYFAPSIPKKPKTKEQWVASAIDLKDVRPQLHYLHSLDGKLYGTNGHIVFWCNTELENGFYHHQTLDKVDTALIYPDVLRVIPKNNTEFTLTDNPEKTLITSKAKPYSGYKIKEALIMGEYYNKTLAGISPDQVTITTYNGPKNSIAGFHSFGGFVVMPILR